MFEIDSGRAINQVVEALFMTNINIEKNNKLCTWKQVRKKYSIE